MPLETCTVRIDSAKLDKVREYVFEVRKIKKSSIQECMNEALTDYVENVLSARMDSLGSEQQGAA